MVDVCVCVVVLKKKKHIKNQLFGFLGLIAHYQSNEGFVTVGIKSKFCFPLLVSLTSMREKT